MSERKTSCSSSAREVRGRIGYTKRLKANLEAWACIIQPGLIHPTKPHSIQLVFVAVQKGLLLGACRLSDKLGSLLVSCSLVQQALSISAETVEHCALPATKSAEKAVSTSGAPYSTLPRPLSQTLSTSRLLPSI